MTDEQINAIKHANAILRAVKLYDLAALLSASKPAAQSYCELHCKHMCQNSTHGVCDGPPAAPAQSGEPIYQARRHEDEEKTWTDCYEATHYATSQCPQFYETRIVYAAPQPSAAVQAGDEVKS